MLAELALVEAEPLTGSVLSARIMIPSGDVDDEWIECGSLTAHLHGEFIISMVLNINDAFIQELDEPTDVGTVTSELQDLRLVLIHQVQSSSPIPFADSVAVEYRTALFVQHAVYNRKLAILVPVDEG